MQDIDLELFAEMVADRLFLKLNSAKRFVSPAEYAASHSLGKRTVDRYLAEGRLEHRRAGRRILIPIDAEIR